MSISYLPSGGPVSTTKWNQSSISNAHENKQQREKAPAPPSPRILDWWLVSENGNDDLHLLLNSIRPPANLHRQIRNDVNTLERIESIAVRLLVKPVRDVHYRCGLFSTFSVCHFWFRSKWSSRHFMHTIWRTKSNGCLMCWLFHLWMCVPLTFTVIVHILKNFIYSNRSVYLHRHCNADYFQ